MKITLLHQKTINESTDEKKKNKSRIIPMMKQRLGLDRNNAL